MRFDVGRNHPQFDLNGGNNGNGADDYKRVVRAARDPISVPTDPVIVELATKSLCHLGLDQEAGCFTLTSMYGIVEHIAYGASLAEWEAAAARLLKGAMSEE